MVDEQHGRSLHPERREHRDLVQILHDDVAGAAREHPPEVPGSINGEAVACSGPVHVDTVERRSRRASRPAGHQGRHRVSTLHESAERLVQVDLRAAGAGVFAVEPIHDEDPHGTRACVPVACHQAPGPTGLTPRTPVPYPRPALRGAACRGHRAPRSRIAATRPRRTTPRGEWLPGWRPWAGSPGRTAAPPRRS